MTETKQQKKVVPIFFATDDNYAPYLAVALESIKAHTSQEYDYKIYILNTVLTAQNYDRLKKYGGVKNFSIEFVNVTEKLDKISSKLHLRDYYTKATYYRFFISSLFPQYDKALYLDCDIVVLRDIAALYGNDISDNYVGAVQEEVMATVKVFGDYVEQALGVPVEQYFNAGILLMNLKQFRNIDIENRFVELLSKYKFSVTQDQDYLNVICKDRVTYFNLGWNKTPIARDCFSDEDLKLIHYKINWKPWHYDGVLYGDEFWKYALKTEYANDLIQIKENYSDAEKERDLSAYNNLVQLALKDTADENNYCRIMKRKAQEEKSFYSVLENAVRFHYMRKKEVANGTVQRQIAGVEEN